MQASRMPNDGSELIEHTRRSWAALQDTLGRVTDERMIAAGVGGGWSGKDHLAHLTAWHEVLVGRLGDRPDHELLEIDEETYDTSDADDLNEIIRRRHRDDPLPEVRARFERSYGDVLTALEAITAADLSRPWRPDVPGLYVVGEMIAANTYEHYDQHRPAIQALVEPAGPAP